MNTSYSNGEPPPSTLIVGQSGGPTAVINSSLVGVLREARAQGVPFRAFTPNGPCVYNVAARGGRSEVADKLYYHISFTDESAYLPLKPALA